jgi:hypothetical protein
MKEESDCRRPTLVILTSSSFMPASRPMYLRARSIWPRFSSEGASSGRGTLPVMGAVSSGEVPQVTVGAMSEDEILTTRSKWAPSSDLRVYR